MMAMRISISQQCLIGPKKPITVGSRTFSTVSVDIDLRMHFGAVFVRMGWWPSEDFDPLEVIVDANDNIDLPNPRLRQ